MVPASPAIPESRTRARGANPRGIREPAEPLTNAPPRSAAAGVP